MALLREEEENTRAIRTIFVSQLQVRASERHIRPYFEQAGEVRDVRLIKDKYTQRSKGFCYIEMGKVEDVATVSMLLIFSRCYTLFADDVMSNFVLHSLYFLIGFTSTWTKIVLET